jgi:hypothetical protein
VSHRRAGFFYPDLPCVFAMLTQALKVQRALLVELRRSPA